MKLSEQQLIRLHALLDQALDLADAPLKQWLDSLAETEPELIPVLRQMLDNRAATEFSDFLAALPDLEVDEIIVAQPDTASALRASLVVGPYHLLREIGRGGMGAVWLAEQRGAGLNRRVALKFPHAGPFDLQLAGRFARERDILATLTHPNIAKLFDAGFTDSAQPYLALEYIEGTAITDFCDARRLSLPQRLDLFLQVLGAVQYAHSHLVVHRDLKPSNILVTEDGQVQLLDFGIAKLISEGEAKATELTLLHGLAMTPEYASPEQILGQPITTAADVYSLGVLLHQLLTGALPYRLARESRAALEEAILSAVPDRPSHLPIDVQHAECRSTSAPALRRVLRRGLDAVVLKALNKDPGERYVTADAFSQDIRRYLRGEAVLAQPGSAWYWFSHLVRRHRLAAAVTAGVTLSLAAGLSIALWQANVAHRQAYAAQRETAKAKAVQDFLLDIFRANTEKARDPVAARQTTAREMLDLGAQRVTSALAGAPDSQQEVLATLSDMYYELGLDEQSTELERQRIEILKSLFGPRDRRVAESLIAYASSLSDTDRRDQILPALDEARDILDAQHEGDSLLRGELLIRYAQRYQSISYDKMKEFADRAVDTFRANPSKEHDNLSTALHLAARARSLLGDDRGAEALYQQALAELDQVPNAPNSSVIPTLLYLAEAQYHLLKIPEAERTYRDAVARARARSGEMHIDSIQAESRLAAFLHGTSRRAEARALFTSSLSRAVALKGERDTLLVPQVRALKARAAIADGSIMEAGALLDAVIASNRRNYPKSAILASNLRDAGVLATVLGDYDRARNLFDEALAMWRANVGASADPSTSNSFWLELAMLELASGSASGAAETLQQVRPSPHAEELPLQPDKLRADLLRTRAYLHQGDIAAAEATAAGVLAAIRQSSVRSYFQTLEADAALRLGQAQLRDGRTQSACDNLEHARGLLAANDVDNSPWLAEAEYALSTCLSALSESRPARRLLAHANAITAAYKKLGRHLRNPLPELVGRRTNAGAAGF